MKPHYQFCGYCKLPNKWHNEIKLNECLLFVLILQTAISNTACTSFCDDALIQSPLSHMMLHVNGASVCVTCDQGKVSMSNDLFFVGVLMVIWLDCTLNISIV